MNKALKRNRFDCLTIRHLIIKIVGISAFILCAGQAPASPKCEGVFRAKYEVLAQYPAEVLNNIRNLRPDVYAAILMKKSDLLITQELDEDFYRENLKKYFHGNAFEPVTLYRGIDAKTLSLNFFGEKGLVWTSEKIEDVLMYALSGVHRDSERMFIFKIVVPRFLVYSRSTWPVLRYEDVVDLTPFVQGVAVIKNSTKLANFVEKHAGLQEEISAFFRKKYPGLLEGASRDWKSGDELAPYFKNKPK
ncbi:MAG: hypothetical protein BroJett040_20410 [Oligoflexia bacterium]|nr:MAG: hypothetical protein BroJett040_20410 [Oligoflexia bacterium]